MLDISLVLLVPCIFEAFDDTRNEGPMLEPLELERLAGTRVIKGALGMELEAVVGRLTSASVDEGVALLDFTGIFFTVLVEIVLLNDVLELPKLVLELLLSTSKRFFAAVELNKFI